MYKDSISGLRRATIVPAGRQPYRSGPEHGTTVGTSALRTAALVREMQEAFLTYYRCPGSLSTFEATGALSADEGYFRFEGTLCYGRCVGALPSPQPTGPVPELSAECGNRAALPFDLSEVVTNLQQERYPKSVPRRLERITATAAARKAYYVVRPLLPVGIRKHLQRIRLSGWNRIPFPAWPVDVTVETLMQRAMARMLNSQADDAIPFIWFWPDGADSSAMMTHDVEGSKGREFVSQLMDLDDSFGIKSAFQVVPEWLSSASDGLVDMVRRRGFEVNIHDLNHDGSLFQDRQEFEKRAARINRHARELGCSGFRSGAMYRELSWYDALDFSYDMSVPNVAHLEPQRGGCCTVMPYFIGNTLELPLTTTQDYSLFHILNDYSTALWEEQIDIIRSSHGLISFIVHPDYLVEKRARAVYVNLLARLSQLRSDGTVWIALPGEIDRWWRNRNQMSLVERGGSWTVEGPDSDRARVAYATLENDRVAYKVERASSK